MNPVQEGFALEDLIYKASLNLPNLTHSKRENEIKTHFADSSLNGVDHWIQVGNTHIFIQDKWKESMGQQEVSQFLTCVQRITERLGENQTIYMFWCSKKEPTAHSLKLLNEKEVNVINCSSNIENLARNIIMEICDLLDTEPSSCLIEIKSKPKGVTVGGTKSVVIRYDDTDDGKKLIEDMKNYMETIQNNVFRRVYQAYSMDSIYELQSLMTFPQSKDDWMKHSKLDFSAFMKAVKNVCWPTNKKKLMSRNLFFYVKMRKLTCELSKYVNDYELKRKNLLKNKSEWATGIPTLKCVAEPITEAEFKGAISNCEDYTFNSIVSGKINKVQNMSLNNAFYGHQCNIY